MRHALLPLALAAALLSFSEHAQARPQAASGEIVFIGATSRGAPGRVLGVRANGTGLRRLGPGERRHAWWSPDGTKVVVSRKKLSIMDADGSNVIVLKASCAGRCDADWSADGKRIAYTVVEACAAPPCDSYLATVRADGSGRRILLRFRGASVESPSWSPDGKTIAFVEEAAGVQDLNRVGSSGRGFTRLAPADGGRFAPDYRPVWTPDSKRILFSARRGGVMRVLSVARHGGDLQTLATGWWPVLSPNGKRVAFVSGDGTGYVAPLAGGTARRIARRVDAPFVWAPDGTELAFFGNDNRVHVAAASGKGARAVTGAYARLGSLAWRP